MTPPLPPFFGQYFKNIPFKYKNLQGNFLDQKKHQLWGRHMALNARWFLDCLCKFSAKSFSEMLEAQQQQNQHIILVQHQKRIHSDFLSGRRHLWLLYDDQRWQNLLPQISGSGRIQEVKWGGQGQGVSIRPESLCPHLRHWSLKLYWWLVSQTIRQSSSPIMGTIEELQEAEEGIQLAFRIWHSVTHSEWSEGAYSNTSVE